MKTPINISESEWEVMNVVWQKSPVPASEIVRQLSARNEWHSRTIRTLLDRLVKKGALTIEQDGKRYLYKPAVSMEACIHHESRSFIDRVFGGEPVSMLLNLVKSTKLTADEIKQLKKILSGKEK
jgi:BlaI family penicillinase repressor